MTINNITKCIIFLVSFSIIGCTLNTERSVSNIEDYESFLLTSNEKGLKQYQEEYEFWEEKLNSAPNQSSYLLKMANVQTALFDATGEISHLIQAGEHLESLNKKLKETSASYLRALARNYISQHKFKEALGCLKKAEINGERLSSTQKMLFDVHLELGELAEAKTYLKSFQNRQDFDFLIRKAKLSDHEGDLSSAIVYMELATEKAVNTKNKSLMQWAYTNLADFYGHDGQIERSYAHYLKALQLDPSDSYAKKGIAWIAYSNDKNTEASKHILTKLLESNATPDYHLMLAEISEFEGDKTASEKHLNDYFTQISDARYGQMYNKHKALILTDEYNRPADALALANQEIDQRPTALSYSLKAWSLFNQGQNEAALNIMENHVVGNSFEPEVQYHLASIYKANNHISKANALKNELLGSAFELGPLMEQKIRAL